jgi:hypothetical protein
VTRLFQPPVEIAVETDADGRPLGFRWQERRHQVLRVEQYWRIDTDWWSAAGHTARAYFAVITQAGLLCVLYHDQVTGIWYLSSAYD